MQIVYQYTRISRHATRQSTLHRNVKLQESEWFFLLFIIGSVDEEKSHTLVAHLLLSFYIVPSVLGIVVQVLQILFRRLEREFGQFTSFLELFSAHEDKLKIQTIFLKRAEGCERFENVLIGGSVFLEQSRSQFHNVLLRCLHFSGSRHSHFLTCRSRFARSTSCFAFSSEHL